MYFALIKNFDGLEMYDDIPEIYNATFEQAEIYRGDWDDGVMLCDNLLPDIDKAIEDNVLDLSDIDYFDKGKCIKLKSVLDAKLATESTPRLHELYTILYDYVNRAIELNTGVEIEL